MQNSEDLKSKFIAQASPILISFLYHSNPQVLVAKYLEKLGIILNQQDMLSLSHNMANITATYKGSNLQNDLGDWFIMQNLILETQKILAELQTSLENRDPAPPALSNYQSYLKSKDIEISKDIAKHL